MPGMRNANGWTCVALDAAVQPVWWFDFRTITASPVDLPDLDDPATLGCLLALVREAWPGARITIDIDPWTVPTCVEVRVCPAPGEPCRSFFGRGPAEALVAALEAAPRREVQS
jgi:hypothetical protein